MGEQTSIGRCFSVEELAQRWRCSEQQVRQKRSGWGLKAFRVGKRLLVPEEEVASLERRWLEEEERPAA